MQASKLQRQHKGDRSLSALDYLFLLYLAALQYDNFPDTEGDIHLADIVTALTKSSTNRVITAPSISVFKSM